jgi:PKD repeat protein
MQTRVMNIVSRSPIGAVIVAALAIASCTLERQSAPELSGPSELAQSIMLTAAPDRLLQDGVSQTVVSALARDHEGKPIAGLGLKWSVFASDGSQIPLSEILNTTDPQGRASTRITAPGAPAQMPSSAVRLTVIATPVGNDTSNGNSQRVVVELVPPSGTPAINRVPVPSFTIVPAVANVTQSVSFDASGTTDEGVICGGRCSYQWDFGDLTTGGGVSIGHAYPAPATYTITLTVVDERGGVASTTRSVTVSGPTLPVASFTSSQAGPGAPVKFNALASTVAAGATITKYEWTFDGGSSVTTATGPIPEATFAPGAVTVTLTVTDSLGRKATKTNVIVVT